MNTSNKLTMDMSDQIIQKAEALQKHMHAFIEQKMQLDPTLTYDDCKTTFFLVTMAMLDNAKPVSGQGRQKVIGKSYDNKAYDIIETAYLSFAKLYQEIPEVLKHLTKNGFITYTVCPECRYDVFCHSEDCKLRKEHKL